MPIISPSTGMYPTIEDVFNFTRIHLNDTQAGATNTLGEGRVFTDTWTPGLNVLNMAMQRLQRDLGNRGVPTVREEVFIIGGITPINGPMGLGVPDPTAQQYLSFSGFFDGMNLNSQVALPYGLIMPQKIRQRVTGTSSPFFELPESQDELPSVYQAYTLGFWKWAGDAIWWNGSQNAMDVELTCRITFPKYPTNLAPSMFSSTQIPFLDSGDCLSYACAYIFDAPRVPPGTDDMLIATYKELMGSLANEWILKTQRTPVSRESFGNSDCVETGYGNQT